MFHFNTYFVHLTFSVYKIFSPILKYRYFIGVHLGGIGGFSVISYIINNVIPQEWHL